MKITKTTTLNRPKELSTAQLAAGLTISVGEARKILGVDARVLSDEEITVYIFELTEIAHALLKYRHFVK